MGNKQVTRRVLAYIEENLDNDTDLDLEKIAQALNYSKYYVARAFKESTGGTIHKYIQGIRLERAAEKLAETTQPIIEIALEAGYGSQQAFTPAFRAIYGCTPQEYRRLGGEMMAA